MANHVAGYMITILMVQPGLLNVCPNTAGSGTQRLSHVNRPICWDFHPSVLGRLRNLVSVVILVLFGAVDDQPWCW